MGKSAHRSVRRRRKIGRATPQWLTPEHRFTIHGIYCRAKYMNRRWREIHGGSRHRNHFSVDHIIPLDGSRVCGLHVPWNLRVIEKAVDNRKGNSFEQGEATHGLPVWEPPTPARVPPLRVIDSIEEAVAFARS